MGQQNSRLKVRPRSGRGSTDPETIKDALFDNWNDVQAHLGSFDDSQKDEIKSHFNNLFDGDFDELGDKIFEDKDDFKAYLIELNDDDLKIFT